MSKNIEAAFSERFSARKIGFRDGKLGRGGRESINFG
jgi:hypothetical protein